MASTETLPALPAAPASFLTYVTSKVDSNEPLREIIQPYLKYESKLRALFAQDPSNVALADNVVGLVPIYDGQEAAIKIQARDLEAESEDNRSKYLMALDKKMRKTTGKRAIVDQEEFKRNFDIFTEGALIGLDWTNIVAAGSSVLTPILPVPKKYKKNKKTLRDYYHGVFAPTSDIDLFIYGTKDEEVAIQRMKEVEAIIRGNLLWEATCVRTKNTITIVSQYPNRHIQIVLRLYSSISEILTGFDVNCACVAYNGHQVYASPRAVVSWMLQCNDIDLTRRSPSYEFRLAKYRKRGFEIYFPQLERKRIDPTIYERNIIKLHGLSKLLLLEKLPEASDRDAYLADRRSERGQPGRSSRWSRRSRRTERLKSLRNRTTEVPEWDFGTATADQGEESNYATVSIPYGEGHTANTIQELIYESDLLLNKKNHKPLQEHRAGYLHRHPAFIGEIKYIVEDCCGYCPEPQDEEEKAMQLKDDRFFVRGRIAFLRDDPGRQEIGSFNPLTEDDWTKMAYLNENEALYQAIAANDIPAIKSWIAEGKKLNKRDHTGRTALHLACLASSQEVIKLLIDSGAEISRRLGDGRTALHIAAARGETEIVKMLLLKNQENEEIKSNKEDMKRRTAEGEKSKGAEDDEDKSEDESSFDVVSAGRESVSARTRASFVDIHHKDEEPGDLPKEESDDGDEDIFDINAADWDLKMTPLHYAIVNGHRDIINLLVSDFGADILQPLRGDKNVLPIPLVTRILNKDSQADTLRSLLKLGASSAQVDTEKVSAFMHILYRGDPEHLRVLFEEDAASALAIAKQITVKMGWNPTIENSLLTAIQQGDEEKALILLDKGVSPEITFEALLDAIPGKPDKDAKEKLQRHFKNNFKQPAELALDKKLFKVFRKCIELGVEPSSYTAGGHPSVVGDNDGYNRGANKACTLLDKIHQLIKWNDQKNSQTQHSNSTYSSKKNQSKRKLLKLAAMPKQIVEGSYEYWMAAQLLATENQRREQDNEKIKKENSEIEDDEEAEASKVEENTDVPENPYRELADWLVSKGGKVYHEDFLKFTYRFPRGYGVADETVEKKNNAYHELFKAVWNGDQEALTKITSGSWNEEEEEDPLEVSIVNQLGYTLFSIAVQRKHPKDFLDLLLSIAASQNTPSKTARVRFEVSNSDDDSESEQDSESGSESESSDTEDKGRVISTTTPAQILGFYVPFVLEGEAPVNTQQTNYTLLQQTAIVGDIELFRYLVSAHEKYNDPVAFDSSMSPKVSNIATLCIQYQKVNILEEVLRSNGLGAFAEEEVVEQVSDPGYYMGLSIDGKKRNQWSSTQETVKRHINEPNHECAALLAAYYGSTDVYRWLEEEGAKIALEEYLKRQAESKDPKLDVNLETFQKWLGVNHPLLIHATILNRQSNLSKEEMLAWRKDKIEFFLSRNPLLLNSQENEEGLTPLLLAGQLGDKPAIQALIAAGADIYSSTTKGNLNLAHLILHGKWQRRYDLLDDLYSLLPQDFKEWAFAQRALYQDTEYTPLAYLLHRKQETIWYEDVSMTVNLLPMLLKHSGQVELGIRSTLGDLPLHIAAAKSSLETLQYILDKGQLEQLVTENSNGATALEIASTSWYHHITKDPVRAPYVVDSNSLEDAQKPKDEELEKKRKQLAIPVRNEQWGIVQGEDSRETQVLRMLKTSVKENAGQKTSRVLVTISETNEKVERLDKRQKGGRRMAGNDILSRW
ncbi:hypothetical protein TWF694_006436 [Orbilia ellipsospora]|uniref:Ankyrin repeat protein n=1 Tax=Orbilia ellipsospora TaxID=2528407 RepID=A0AAV9XK66_9PEZI